MAKTKAEFEGATAEAVAAEQDPIVTFRVGPKGDGKISTGEHHSRGGDVLYERGDEFQIAKSIALAHEELGHGEIVKEPKAK
jgi:hypothetical protein